MLKGSIYKISNVINNKNYIGCTTKPIKERVKEHFNRCLNGTSKTKFCNSIRKYGMENFKIKLLTKCELNEIYEKEKYFIKKYDSFKTGLNSTIGGEGCTGYKHSKSVRKKISTSLLNGNSHKGKTYDDIYGKNSNIEKKKRGITAKRNWKNLTIKQKEKKIKKITLSSQNKSKYGVELVIEIKNKFKEGHKVKVLKSIYPQVTESFLYDLKNNRRWKNV